MTPSCASRCRSVCDRGPSGYATQVTDSFARPLVGIGLLALVFVLEGSARWWGLSGIAPIAAGLFRFCPAYTLLGLNTCPQWLQDFYQ